MHHLALSTRFFTSLLCAALMLPAYAHPGNPAPSARSFAPDTACSPPAAKTTGQSHPPGDLTANLVDNPAAPEASSGYRTGLAPVYAKRYMVVTANPLATQAGCEILKIGGSAMDAAVAVQMVLGLVEPQSSGIGGGTLLLYYDARTRAVTAFDGRETAPAAANENSLRWIGATADSGAPQPNVRASGRSIGTPGTVRVLALAHRQHGRLPWQRLFAPAITLAATGFPVSARMANALDTAQEGLRHDADAQALYFDADGAPVKEGNIFTNLPYVQTLAAIARHGADAFYTGAIAQAIVDKINTAESSWDASPITPGLTTLDDLAAYRAHIREAVCTPYRAYIICGMPPPSSGGITVAAMMGILEHFDLSALRPDHVDAQGGHPDALGVHLISEAGRLAYADRDMYLADTDFVPLPKGSWDTLLNKPYLAQRAGLIDVTASMRTAQPGDFGDAPLGLVDTPESGTSHISIVDADGNAVAMTTTVESNMGAYHVTQGFVLNNELTDFAIEPTREGKRVANRMSANKRPRSSMAPTLVFRMADDGGIGELLLVTGSPGGAAIIQYVAKTLVGILDWGLDAQQAAGLVNIGAGNSPTTYVGGEHPYLSSPNNGDNAPAECTAQLEPQAGICARHPLVQGLLQLGHEKVSVRAQTSGIATIVRVERAGQSVWEGGVDPRREGLALGDGEFHD